MTGETTQALISTVVQVKDRIAELRHRKSRVGEQNTKSVLIEPMLSALGWNVWDLNEVSREYRHKSQDNPVDYALLLDHSPCLFVEAKALGTALRDRRLASQSIAYAATVGVEWCVLTDGDEYRIYNAHAPVDVDEKLFRTVTISKAATADDTVDIISLLSKNKMAENQLGILWKGEYIDRRVKAALEDSFRGQNVSLINLLKKRLGDLPRADIRGALKRLDIIVKTSTVTTEPERPPTGVEEGEQDEMRPFWTMLLEKARDRTELFANISASRDAWIATSTGTRGLTFGFATRQHDGQVEVYIDCGKNSDDENLQIFRKLKSHRDKIEDAFGDQLEWQELPGKRACRIRKIIDVGGYRDTAHWSPIHHALIDAMIRLDRALRPYIERL